MPNRLFRSGEHNILFVHYHFPPVQTAGTVRIRHIFREFQHYFSGRFVLTSEHRRLLVQDPGRSIDIPHLETLPTYDLRRLLLRRQGTPTLSSAAKTGAFAKTLARLTDSFPFNLLWGDGGLVYILAGYRAGIRLIEQEKITHLFSSFRPYADHAVAFLLKRRFPQLVWVADFRDLHIGSPLHQPFFPRFQQWCTRRILSRADLVTTVSEGLARSLRPFHHRVYVLRNGIDPALLASPSPPAASSAHFRITYTGSLYPGLQTPAPLLEALNSLIGKGLLERDRLQLIYAGKDGSLWQRFCREAGLVDRSTDLGLVPRAQALDLQRQSHLNLLLSWAGPAQQGILTAKLYEYLVARRPLLAIINGTKDSELSALIEGTHAGLAYATAADSLEALQRFILKYYRQWERTGTTMAPVTDEQLRALSWERLARDLVREMGR